MIRYERGLSKEDRSKFTMRLVTLHGILANEKTIQYKHDVWTENGSNIFQKIKGAITGNRHCGTAACALGHAVMHRDKFPGMVVQENPKAAQRVLGITDASPAGHQTFEYFGPHAYHYIFHGGAYNKPVDEVTREDAMERIVQYIEQGLGCKLIEGEAPAVAPA